MYYDFLILITTTALAYVIVKSQTTFPIGTLARVGQTPPKTTGFAISCCTR